MALQHPVPDDHLKHIGDMTVSFALLENCLQSLAQSLLGAGQRMGQIITAEVSFRALRALTVSLYLQRNGEDQHIEQFRALIRRAADVEEKRNQITHSLWGAGTTAESITRIKVTAKEKHGIRFRFDDVTAKDLAAAAQEIKDLAQDIQRFWFTLVSEGKATNG
jgi:hypothetical protein